MAKTISFDEPLKYFHYGHPANEVATNVAGKYDLRASAGHLSRNIKIMGNIGKDKGWGCRIFGVGFLVESDDGSIKKWRRGSI